MTIGADDSRTSGDDRSVRTTAERYYGSLSLDLLRQEFTSLLEHDVRVPPSTLLTIATLLQPQCRASEDKRALAQEFYTPIYTKWRRENVGKHVITSAPVGIVTYRTAAAALEATPTSDQPAAGGARRGLRGPLSRFIRGPAMDADGPHPPAMSISLGASGAPDFNWVPARTLLHRVDSIGDMAGIWVPEERQRAPHIERASGLASQVLAIVGREWRRRVDAETPHNAPPTESFLAEVEALRPHVEDAERLLVLSATHRAQTKYLGGVAYGAIIMAGVSLVVGLALLIFGQDASLGIAFPAGALGAVISVLQRMTSGSLELDFRAPARRLDVFGRARPCIGAVFGMFVYALLHSRLGGVVLPRPGGTGQQLAYFAVVGFLAGFNERFAQDAVSGSTAHLGTALTSH